MKTNILAMLLVLPIYLGALDVCYASDKKLILGNIETVILFPGNENLPVQAKFDTGANTSSLSAYNIKTFTKNGKKYVKFTIDHDNLSFAIKKTLAIKKKVSIKNHSHLVLASLSKNCRPVVRIKLCVGNIAKTIDVNLVDRSNFSYPLLIGNNAIIKFAAIIDPSMEYTITPMCNIE